MKLPTADGRNHTPIIEPTRRAGASLVTALRPTGDRQSSPIVCSRYRTVSHILIHGAGRDADNYFRTAVAAAFLASALEDTIVLSPRFASNDGGGCRDTLAQNEVNYSCSGDSWRPGGVAINNERLTSYDFMDEILRKLARKETFPNLTGIVVSGHSAGGQFVNRYQMSNQVHDTLGVPITYIVSNPSSYAYLDSIRPSSEGSDFRAF